MAEIIPAIMPKNWEDLKNHVAKVRDLVPLVQVDICDGKFVKTTTWPFHDNDVESLENILNEREGMPYWEDINFELDMMTYDAMENFGNYMRLGPKRIIFHIEAQADLVEFKEFIEAIDMYTREHVEIGVAINTTTPIEMIDPLINNIDFVQCMGIEQIGLQGQEFDVRVLDRIKTLRKKFPDIVISVDGAVNMDTAPQLIDAGAQRLVIGSAIFKANDIINVIEEFKHL